MAYGRAGSRSRHGMAATDFMAGSGAHCGTFAGPCIRLAIVGRPDWRDQRRPQSSDEKGSKHAFLLNVNISYIGETMRGFKRG